MLSELPSELVVKVICHVSPQNRMATMLICKFWEKVFEVNRFYNSALNLIEQKRISQCQDSPRCWKEITQHTDTSIIDQVPEILRSMKMRYLRQLKVYSYMTHDIGVVFTFYKKKLFLSSHRFTL